MINNIEIFRRKVEEIEKDLCFVLMPFRDQFEELYKYIIKPTIEQIGMKCLRADEIYDIKPIMINIWENIQKANIIIADLTEKNPNVLYELGLCHATNKNVIIITQSLLDVPFDLRQWRCIEYTPTPGGCKDLQNALLNTILTLKIEKDENEKLLLFEIVFRFGQPGKKTGQLNNPRGLFLDKQGNFFISDGDNHRVQKFTAKGEFIKTWGKKGIVEGEFDSPRGILVDDDRYVFVADHFNNRLQKFTTEGEFIRQIGHETGDSILIMPYGITMDKEENLYITCTDGLHQVKKISKEGKFILQWGGFGKEIGKLNNPLGIGIDKNENIYVIDNYNHRIQKFTKNGEFILSWGKQGNESGHFSHPHSIAIDKENNIIYVTETDNLRIQLFDTDGKYLGKIATSDDIAFYRSTGLFVDSDGYLYVLNRGLNQILKLKRNFAL